MLKELSMLKIKDIYKANVLKFVYKCINEPNTPIFRTFFQKRNEFHDRVLRYTDRLHILAATTALAQRATRNTGVYLWNKLPEEIKNQTDIKKNQKRQKTISFRNIDYVSLHGSHELKFVIVL